mgnify:FL=1
MAEKKSLLFVVNPISGGKSKQRVPALINKYLNHAIYSHEVYTWEIIDDLPNAIQVFKDNNGYAVVAIGGDGTINAVASCLIDSGVKMAIIPQGSGNGFAREFKISTKIETALRQLNTATEHAVDVGKMNGKVFVNVAGWGFDAKVSHSFAQLSKRGLKSYARSIMNDFGGAENLHFEVKTEEGSFESDGFLLSIANGRQWGNNFYVAPKASFSDGILDLVFLQKPKVYQAPYLALCLFMKWDNGLITRRQIRKASIRLNRMIYTHLDGEPSEKVDQVSVEVLPNALKVLA